jgi:hypothetical protein
MDMKRVRPQALFNKGANQGGQLETPFPPRRSQIVRLRLRAKREVRRSKMDAECVA